MSPVKSGSAKTCALIVNVQGAARRTGKKVRRIERGPAPSVRAATAAIANAPRANSGDDDREQSVAAERVRSVGEELRAPLLVGPVTPEPEHGQLVCARKAVLDDLASRDERQPGVCDEERRREDGEEDDAERRVEDDEEELLPGDPPDPVQRAIRPRRWGSRPGRAGRRGAWPRCGSSRRACGRCSSGGT